MPATTWRCGRSAVATPRPTTTSRRCCENYITTIHDGAIVIFHDGIGRSAWELTGPDDQLVTQRTAEIEALPAVIDRYLADGYELVTISQPDRPVTRVARRPVLSSVAARAASIVPITGCAATTRRSKPGSVGRNPLRSGHSSCTI